MPAAVVGATSYGAVGLAQSTAGNGSVTSVSHQDSTGSHVSSGMGQAPVANSGGS